MDLSLIADWMAEGRGLMEITSLLNGRRGPDGYTLTYQQIHLDMREVEKRWKLNQLEKFDELRGKRRAELERLKRVAWDEWYASKRVKEISTSEQAGERRRVSLRREERVGDPRFLEVIHKCIDRLIKLDGVDVQETVELVIRKEAEEIAREFGLDPADVLREAQDVLRRSRGES